MDKNSISVTEKFPYDFNGNILWIMESNCIVTGDSWLTLFIFLGNSFSVVIYWSIAAMRSYFRSYLHVVDGCFSAVCVFQLLASHSWHFRASELNRVPANPAPTVYCHHSTWNRVMKTHLQLLSHAHLSMRYFQVEVKFCSCYMVNQEKFKEIRLHDYKYADFKRQHVIFQSGRNFFEHFIPTVLF